MRFKAIIKRPKTLRDICGAIAGVQKTCLIQLDPQEIKLISVQDRGGVQLWSSLSVENMFEEWIIQSKEDNKIHFEVNIDQLHRALRSYNANGLDDVFIRLKKRGRMAYLLVIIELHTLNNTSNTVTQEIPVKLIHVRDSDVIGSPPTLAPDAFMLLKEPYSPYIKISDRYRFLGSKITVKIDGDNKLHLSTENQGLSVETTWNNMPLVSETSSTPSSTPASSSQLFGKSHTASVTVDVKDWWCILQIHNVAKKIIIGVCEEHALILYCYVVDSLDGSENQEDYLTYYVGHRSA